jgi:anaerobic selenocysteine-containing dehydrogenase
VIEPGVPDMNPRGCQKGGSFSQVMYGAERIKYPLKRVGARGAGKWQRVSWDEALTEVADAMITAASEVGPESIVFEVGPGNIGIFQALSLARLASLTGATTLDVDGLIGDFNVGNYITFGKFQHCSSNDDWFHAELILIWHMNPLYTRIPEAHYITEARYKGAEIVSIAPDFNPSCIHADLYVPVEPGSDAALGLGMAQVIVAEQLYDAKFVKEQTDLALLVRQDTKKFLRAADLESGGRDDQFYVLDAATKGIAKAPRAALGLAGTDPTLEGHVRVRLLDGGEVEATPAFGILRQHLEAYAPEKAAQMCGTPADVIRDLARKVAKKRTHILLGWNSNKYYHGDLMERAQCLVLALTGNWGKKGTGTRGWNECGDPKQFFGARRTTAPEEFGRIEKILTDLVEKIRATDPTMTEEMLAIERERLVDVFYGGAPPVFYWYHHAGYREVWNKKEWGDPTMKRGFDDYMTEAMNKKWWEGMVEPAPERPPQVLIGAAGSTLRRTRGGGKMLLEHLWPKLKLILTVDPRMSTTAMYSDIVLPVAWFYERSDFRFFTPHTTFNTFTDKAVEPLGESKSEWEICALLAKKIGERAKARGLEEYTKRRRLPSGLVRLVAGTWGEVLSRLSESEIADRVITTLFPGREAMSRIRRYDAVYERYTFGGELKEADMEKALALFVEDSVREGIFPEGTTLDTYREKGIVRFVGLGRFDPVALNMACDVKPDETVNPLTWHTQKKVPYPTLTRRAQFYIDHDWFLEAGEGFPVHKPNPQMGGHHPFRMTSGHQRWSIHSIWVTNKMLSHTHQGRPTLFINPEDAKRKGIGEGDLVRVFNDFASFKVHVKLAPGARPGQVIIYHAWEPYQFPEWKSYDVAIPGMVKWLHLAGGYGHLRHWRWNWQPQQADRAVAVDLERA